MIQGTSSGAGKSMLVTALCRILINKGFKVAPFKSQNMSSFTYKIQNTDKVIANAQAIQAMASRAIPDCNMNPILLKPIGNSKSRIYTNGEFLSVMEAKDYYSDFVLNKGLRIALDAFRELRKNYEIIILEGAGSPAEINIQKYDIANMIFAAKVNAPVILVSDIERGGCFASILGTMMLLRPSHQRLVKGILINKFRGDNAILSPAIKKIESKIEKPILGIIPKIDHNIPKEDSLDRDNSDKEIKQSQKENKKTYARSINKNDNTDENQKATDQSALDAEISRFAEKVESSINMDYVLKKIIG
ncbi:putative cobyric acid synthase [Candidatus Nitrosocosmicus arcticus]|uniref:Putative cobyric acid synthase n=2 Tax=Candidatus Nitrosocosmicus arcticus TaxID=2035267 RepID=A0A557SXM0_9ARCH|nr:putative cobyric acid synthase [Candidatus Nitrosocosmicus arcticus]